MKKTGTDKTLNRRKPRERNQTGQEFTAGAEPSGAWIPGGKGEPRRHSGTEVDAKLREKFIGFYREVSRCIAFYRTEEARNYAFSRILSIGAFFQAVLGTKVGMGEPQGHSGTESSGAGIQKSGAGKGVVCGFSREKVRVVARKFTKFRTDQGRKSSIVWIVTGETFFRRECR